MLLRLTISGFRSFDGPETLELFPSTRLHDHPTHVAEPAPGVSALTLGAIYGANGAGKSALVRSLRAIRGLLVHGLVDGLFVPFAFAKVPPLARIEMTFAFDGRVFEYGVEASTTVVHSEWLIEHVRGRERLFFERTSETREGGAVVTFGPGIAKRARERATLVAESTSGKQSFLHKLNENRIEEVSPVFAWVDNLVVLTPGVNHIDALYEFPTVRENVAEHLAAFGTGVARLRSVVETLPAGALVPEGFSRQVDGTFTKTHLLAAHRGRGGTYELPFADESDGTRQLAWLTSFLGLPCVIVVDEIDQSLHPLAVRQLLEMVAAKKTAVQQLLFTTHDTTVLDQELLRRDEVWFVEKDEFGASHLTSLADFKLRNDASLAKGYLNGRFGAIPFLGNIERLGLREDVLASGASPGRDEHVGAPVPAAVPETPAKKRAKKKTEVA